ncbi:Mitochondrial DNA polymerase gamma, catalytic subunit [Phaffia rhodozyma]|uniref:Mitochondrial DNA polymerase catalytic subunit n=1 Tax=Phaffia rhodozyma TaxID=264483 RepID=A0A0F7SNB7_PHARH|nr:Mitochondrial DNA polymerase gamma, catalytic subunit [Phaffia rhodozyma]
MRLIPRAVVKAQPLLQPALISQRQFSSGEHPPSRRSKAKPKEIVKTIASFLPARPPFKNPFELLGHATRYGAQEADNPLYPRYNPAKIQLVSSLVHKQIFPEPTSSSPTPEALEVFSRVTSEQTMSIDGLMSRKQTSLPLPPQLGGDLRSHFEAMASKVAEPYLKLSEQAAAGFKNPVPSTFPDGSACVSGWSRFDVDTESWIATPHPVEQVLIVTYDKMPQNHRWPLFACASSPTDTYIWVSPWLTGDSDHFKHLISFGHSAEPRLIISNDLVGFRPCVQETYNIQDSALRFLSMGGLLGSVVTQGKKIPEDNSKDHSDFEPSLFEGVYNQSFPKYPIRFASQMPSVVRTPAKAREVTEKSLKELFERLRGMGRYFQLLFKNFRKTSPSLVSLSGPLRMGTSILPVDHEFSRFVANSEQALEDTLQHAQTDLALLAEEARLLWTPPSAQYKPDSPHSDPIELPPQIANDEFLSRLDWTPQRAKHVNWPTEFTLKQSSDPLAISHRQNAPMNYDELVSSKLIPTQIGLRFNGHPIVYSEEHGFIYFSPTPLENQQPLEFSDVNHDVHLAHATSTSGAYFYRLPSRPGLDIAVRSVLNKDYLKRSFSSPLSCVDPKLLDLIRKDADTSLILETVSQAISSYTMSKDKISKPFSKHLSNTLSRFDDTPNDRVDLRNNVTVPARIGLTFDGHSVVYSAEHGFVYRTDAPIDGYEPLQFPKESADNVFAFISSASEGYFYHMPTIRYDGKEVRSVLGARYLTRVGFNRFSCANSDLLQLIRDRADNESIMNATKRAMAAQDRLMKEAPHFDYPAPSKSALEAYWWPKWFSDLFDDVSTEPANRLNLPISHSITPILLRLCWKGYPLYRSRRHGWVYRVPTSRTKGVKLHTNMRESGDHYLQQLGAQEVRTMERDGFLHPNRKPKSAFFRIPSAVKISQAADDIWSGFIRGGRLTSSHPKAQAILESLASGTIWTLHRERMKSAIAMKASEDHPMGFDQEIRNGNQNEWSLIAPRVSPMASLTRQAADDIWLNAPNPRSDQIGTEVKAMVKAPEGYRIVGAAVESQEAWITSTLGDAQFGFHGATPDSRKVLNGNEKSQTDIHSQTAAMVNTQAAKVFRISEPVLSREQAKTLNHHRAFGGTQHDMAKQIYLSMPKPDQTVAGRLARWLRIRTRGWRSRASKMHHFWCEGTESFSSNSVENIAQAIRPVTPLLGACIPYNIQASRLADPAHFRPIRIDWSVKSSGVDYLHCLITSMDYLCTTFEINARFLISNHDEVRYLVREEDSYRAALALQISNLWTRALMSQRLGMEDLPHRAAFFPSIDIDTVLRADVNNDCVTPSHPTPIPAGETANIREILKKTNSSLLRDGPIPASVPSDKSGGSTELERILEDWKKLYADRVSSSTALCDHPKFPSLAQVNADPDWRRFYLYAQTGRNRAELKQLYEETGEPEDWVRKSRGIK